MHSKKYLFFGGSLEAFVNFRSGLTQQILTTDETATILCAYFGNLENIETPDIDNNRLSWADLKGSHTGTILKDLGALWSLWQILRSYKPKTIIAFNAKPIFYIGLLKRLGLVSGQITILFEGMGLGFSAIKSNSVKARLLQEVLKLSFRSLNSWIFLNKHDHHWLLKKTLIRNDALILNITGIGINISHFKTLRTAAEQWEEKSVGFAGRFIKEKGPHIFAEIAKIVHEVRPDIDFHMAGRKTFSSSSISTNELDSWLYSGQIKSIRYYSDMYDFYQHMTLLVLPTTYNEGLPAVAMECQAMGIPILLNDMKQVEASVCPKHVHHRIDGNSAAAYADLILTYFDKKDLYCEAAETASAYARKQFDEQKINQQIIQFLGMNHVKSG